MLTSPIEMASSVAQLEKLWCEAAPGRLAPLEQVKAWAMREAQRKLTGKDNLQEIADWVKTKTEKKKNHPTCNASRTYNATGPAKGSDLAKVTDPDRAEVTNHTPPHPTCI